VTSCRVIRISQRVVWTFASRPAWEIDDLVREFDEVRKCVDFCWNETVYDRFFYVNQGWGGAGNDWVAASTWFAGEIHP